MDVLVRIKRLVLAGQVLFTAKAEAEMVADALTQAQVYEAIVNAPAVYKILRSRRAGHRDDILYVIKGLTFDGMVLYTKGKILKRESREVFYVLISSKRASFDG